MICSVKSISGTGFLSTMALCNGPSMMKVGCAHGAENFNSGTLAPIEMDCSRMIFESVQRNRRQQNQERRYGRRTVAVSNLFCA